MVGIGGALGSMARHGVNVFVSRHSALAVPFATGTVNLIGCLIIGVVAGLVVGQHVHLGQSSRTFAMVGILGGFTTFSSFGLDTFTLLKDGQVALASVAVQVVGGLAGVALGYWIAK